MAKLTLIAQTVPVPESNMVALQFGANTTGFNTVTVSGSVRPAAPTDIISVQPDGQIQGREAIQGAYEMATVFGLTVRYSPTGNTSFWFSLV